MIIPQTNLDCPSTPEADSPLNSFLQGSAGFTGLFIIFLLLVFYGLALWDRWMQLKLREYGRLSGNDSPSSYGSVVYSRKFPVSEASSSRVPSMESLRSDNNGHNVSGTPHKQKTLVPPKMSSRSIK